MKIRGKKLTSSQRRILTNSGIQNPDDYLYVKTEVINLGGKKHLDQNCPKIENIIVIHRENGEVKRIATEV